MKYLYHTIKWSTILAIVLSIWIVAAWLKADLKPDLIQPMPTHRVVEIVAQKPTSGQEWATYEGAKVRFLQDKQTNTNRDQRDGTVGSGSGSSHVNPSDAPRSATTSPALEGTDFHANGSKSPSSPAQAVLPLGRFLVPTGGRDPLWVTPELDPVSGETKLQAQPAGGFARFGGERFAGGSFELLSNGRQQVEVLLHQDLGRLGKLEFSVEGFARATLNQIESDNQFGVRARIVILF